LFALRLQSLDRANDRTETEENEAADQGRDEKEQARIERFLRAHISRGRQKGQEQTEGHKCDRSNEK